MLRFLRRWWIDLCAVPLAIALGGFAIILQDLYEEGFILLYLFWPVGFVLWSVFRMTPVIQRLTQRDQREQMALILLESKNVIERQLRPVFNGLLSAWLPLFILMNSAFLKMAWGVNQMVLWLLVLNALGVGSHLFAAAGLLAYQRRLCVFQGDSGRHLWFLCLYTVSAIGVSIGAYLLIIVPAIFGISNIDEEGALFVLGAWSLPSFSAAILVLLYQWKKACQDFFRFEPPESSGG
ncbi:hypothetical protein JXA32_16255 [Candidatus Sumerlaeota bacterium]|nr:hypothetical protein [Candidatus Sumerlaeota bacterium]